MNFCTWALRHEQGCGWVSITAHQTGITVVVPVVDFGDLYTGTPDQRIVDLQYGVVADLGLDLAQGLYEVTVWPAQQPQQGNDSGGSSLPNTAVGSGRAALLGMDTGGLDSQIGLFGLTVGLTNIWLALCLLVLSRIIFVEFATV